MLVHRMTPVIIVVIMVASGAATALAQNAVAPGWRVIPRLGTFFGDYSDSVVLKGSVPQAPRRASVDQGAMVGIGLDFDSPLWWLGFRLSADRTIDADARFRRGPACTQLPCPPAEIVHAEAKLTAFSIDVRLQPAPRDWPLRPFVSAGFDRLRVAFDDDVPVGDRPEEEVRPAFHFGYGVDFDIFGVPLRIEGVHRKFYQEEDPTWGQTHYFLMGGVRIPMD